MIDKDIADLRAAARFARASVRRVVRTDMGASASRALGDLSPGCEIFCATKGQFDLIDAVGALIAQTGSADLDIAVWNVYDAPVRRLAQWQAEGRIGPVPAADRLAGWLAGDRADRLSRRAAELSRRAEPQSGRAAEPQAGRAEEVRGEQAEEGRVPPRDEDRRRAGAGNI